MGLLMDFIGGAADAGGDILKQAMAREAEEEKEKRLAKLREEMEVKRMRTAEAIRRESEQLSRKQDAADYEKIKGQSGSIVDDQIRKSTNVGDPNALSREQLDVIKGSQRGLIHNNAQSETRVMADLARGIGRNDMAKELMAEANTERQWSNQEINQEHMERRLDLQDKKQDQQFEWQKTQAGIANRRADLAEARANRQQDYMELRDSRADADSKRRSAEVAVKDLAAQAKDLQRSLDSGMLTDEVSKIYRAEIAAINKERTRYRDLLGTAAGLEPVKDDDNKPKTTITLQQVEGYAKKKGISVDAAMKDIEREGKFDLSGLKASEPAAAPTQAKLTTENTRILNKSAGKFNVEITSGPRKGQTMFLSKDELEALGYKTLN